MISRWIDADSTEEWLPLPRLRVGLVCALAIVLFTVGCAKGRYIMRRERPHNPLAIPLNLLGRSGPKPTPRTEQLLRRYALLDQLKEKPQQALELLQEEIQADPTPEKIGSYAELAYIQ